MLYNDRMDPDTQITTEEHIASLIFDNENVETDEETAAQLGRDILAAMIRVFRPDLVGKL